MTGRLKKAVFFLFSILFITLQSYAQPCWDSVDPGELMIECQFANPGLAVIVDENCNCIVCDDHPGGSGCFGDGGTEIPVPLDDYVWLLIGMGLTVGVWKLRGAGEAA